MSLFEFKSYERFGGQTVAESKAEVAESGNYAIWLEDEDTQGKTELHFQRLDQEFIPDDDEALIETVFDHALTGELLLGNDRHAMVAFERWVTPDGEILPAEELMNRLLRVL